MKTSKIITVTALVLVTAALTGVSIYAYASAGSAAATTYQPNMASPGTNGYYPNGMMSGNWGGMMSGNGMMGGYSGYSAVPSEAPNSVVQQNTVLPLIGLAALIGAVATGAGGAAYFLAVPKMRITQPAAERTIVESTSPQNILAPYVSVSKTLTPEERKVFDVLVSHDGKYLQKYIRAETGLSRLKTHRIVARLAERGIVTLEKSGNTNEVHLSSWLQNSNVPEQNHNERMRNIEISA